MASSSTPGSEWVVVEPEQEKAQRQSHLHNLNSCLYISLGILALMLIWVVRWWWSPNTECGNPRFQQAEDRIRGLQTLWSNRTALQIKYDLLASEFAKHREQVNEMNLIYSNITEVKAILGDVQSEIDEIHHLEAVGKEANKRVERSLGDMTNLTTDLNARLHDGLAKVSKDAVVIAQKSVAPAVQEMRKDIEADEKKSNDALQADLDKHWRIIDGNLDRLNTSLIEETNAMSTSLEEKTNTLSTSINAKVAESTAPVTKALAMASQAKSAGDEARSDAQSAVASIDGVGFIKLGGTDCPEGSKKCVLWSWFNPQLMDPYCSHGSYVEQADGQCERSFNGELENQMFGCCRDGGASEKENETLV